MESNFTNRIYSADTIVLQIFQIVRIREMTILFARSTKSGTFHNKPLRGCVFVLEGFKEEPEKEKELKSKIKSWDGKVESQVTKSTTALILANKGKTFRSTLKL